MHSGSDRVCFFKSLFYVNDIQVTGSYGDARALKQAQDAEAHSCAAAGGH